MSNITDEIHPLDEALGHIHQAAIAIEFIASSTQYSNTLQSIAMLLAKAHEDIQNWLVKNDKSL